MSGYELAEAVRSGLIAQVISDVEAHLESAHRPMVILIAGGTCSGKSTLAEQLADMTQATVLALDNYMHTKAWRNLHSFNETTMSWDHPGAYNYRLALQDLQRLLSNVSVQRKFANGESLELKAAPVVIVEGLHALRTRFAIKGDLGIFVDLPAAYRLERRLARHREQEKSKDEIIKYFEEIAEPLFRRYVAPTRPAANVTITG